MHVVSCSVWAPCPASRVLRAAPHTPACLCPALSHAPLKLGPVEQKILEHIEKQHCGNGDPELEDAKDPCDYLTERFGGSPGDFMDIIRALQRRLEHLDGTWTGRRPEPISSMPITPEPGRAVEMWVSVTHLGFKVDSSLKGKSKAIRILDCVEDFLKEPFASMRSPLNILVPWVRL